MRELREIALVASCLLIAVGAGSAISVGCGGDTGSGGAGGTGTFSSLPSTGGNTNAGGTNAGGTSVFTTSTGGAGPGGTGGSNTSNAGGSNTGGSGGAGGTGGTNSGGGGATASSAASTAASSAASSSASSSAASSTAASSTASSSASSSTAASSSAASSSSTGGGNTLTVWINELHYDNTGGDTGEGVEIAGVAGTDLTGYSVVLYDGATGHTYDNPLAFTGAIPNQSNGFGAVNVAHGAIQNGPGDGLALIGPGSVVVQFLSYEGTFAATNGPAMGMTSIDIGVSENGSGAVGTSLQLTGAGHTYSDFSWAANASATPGAINDGQTFP